MPLVTILLPLKNYHPDFLRRAVASIRDQDSPDWRLLVIVEPEDREHFQELLADTLADERAALVVNEGRKLAGAVNTGIRHADTPFVALLLGDDMWAPHAVSTLTEHIQRYPDVDFFHSSRVIVDEHDAAISSVYPSRESFTIADFKRGSPVKHLLCWRRRKALDIGGLDESLNSVGPDDYDFPWTMAERGAVFHAISDCLYIYRDHRAAYRLTTHLPLKLHRRELTRIMRKHGVPAREIRKRIRKARGSFLRQCLYRSRFDQFCQRLLGRPPRPWRETYR